jgi:hypothetical protein
MTTLAVRVLVAAAGRVLPPPAESVDATLAKLRAQTFALAGTCDLIHFARLCELESYGYTGSFVTHRPCYW